MSVYRFIDECLRKKVDSIIKLPNKSEELKAMFIKYIKHNESKYIKNKIKFMNVLTKNNVEESLFKKIGNEAKKYYDVNNFFFDKINFPSIVAQLSKFGLLKINFNLLEKVIYIKPIRNLQVEEIYVKIYLDTLRDLENSQFFDETLRQMNFLPNEKSKLTLIKSSIDNFLLDCNCSDYKAFLNIPFDELTQLDYFKLKIINCIDLILKQKITECKNSIYTMIHEFIGLRVGNFSYISIIEEIDRIITIFWINLKKAESNTQYEIMSLFCNNPIDHNNPDNLFVLQLRRIICSSYLELRNEEEQLLLQIMSIYKCKNDREMIEKYLSLYREKFEYKNSSLYICTVLKYLKFVNKTNEFNSIFKLKFNEKEYFQREVENECEAKIICYKFQLDFNSRHQDDDKDHSNVLLFLEKNKGKLY